MGDDSGDQEGLASCVRSVERILNYNFLNTKLIEDALTHPSFPDATTSFQRLEFLGDAALDLAVSNFIFISYPGVDTGKLSLIRSSNVSTEKLARVAVRHGFYHYVRHYDVNLITKVKEFVLAVMEEDEMLLYGGVVRAPKVLADLVESIAGAVYIDCGFDLKAFWLVFRGLLEPIVTLEIVEEHERPLKTLEELCWSLGMQVEIRQWRVDSKRFTNIYVDGKLVGSGTSFQKETSRLIATREALRTLAQANVSGGGTCGFASEVDERNKVLAAKLKLSKVCARKKWPPPSYRVEKEEGQTDVKKYVCSVHIEVEEAVLVMYGDEQSTVEGAENSAASYMLCSLLANGRLNRSCRITKKRRRVSFMGNDKDVGEEVKISGPASGDVGKEDQHQENSISSNGDDKEDQHQETSEEEDS